MATRFTNPRLTMSLWRSGSWTTRRASSTAVSVTGDERENIPPLYRAGRSRALGRPDLLLGDFAEVGQLEALALERAEHAIEPDPEQAEHQHGPAEDAEQGHEEAEERDAREDGHHDREDDPQDDGREREQHRLHGVELHEAAFGL